MIHSLELTIVQDAIAVRKLPNVFLAEIFFFFLNRCYFGSCQFVMQVIPMHRVLSRL